MRKKEFFITLFVLLLGFISLYIFSVLDIQLQEYAKKRWFKNTAFLEA